MRICGLILLASIIAAADPVVATSPPMNDILAPHEQPDGAGGTIRIRVVRQHGARHPLRVVERTDALGSTTADIAIADQLLVALRPGTDAGALATAHGCTVRRGIPGSAIHLLAFALPDARATDRMRDRLAASPQVLRVEYDRQVRIAATPDDGSFPNQWGLRNTGQAGGLAGADIKATTAWDIHTGNRNVVVGIIDTGIDHDHPDLAANLWSNPGESGLDAQGRDKRTNGVDDDGNGYVDDWRGWDFVHDDNDPRDDHGHGTHCAAIIGATGNDGAGITGVCWRVSLVGLKFLDANGSGYLSDAVSAVRYAAALHLPIISNSWGSTSYSAELDEAFAQAAAQNVLICAAAGNGYGSDNDRHAYYPACFSAPTLISVASSNRFDALSWFSNLGRRTVHLAAPGEQIYSTIPGTYGWMSGTSMATPHVAGVAALILAARPGLDATTLRQLILDGTERLPAFAQACTTGGRLDAAASLRLATGAWLRDGSLAVDDQDGDGICEPGEPIGLVWTLANAGSAASGPVQVTLADAGDDAATTITAGATAIASIAAGASGTGTALTFTTPADLATPRAIRLVLTATWGDGRQVVREITLTLRRACSLAGTVRRLTGGATVGGAMISATPAEADAATITGTSGGDGSYALSLPEGTWTIQARSGALTGPERTITCPPSQTLDLPLGAPDIRVDVPVPTTVAQGRRATITLPIADQGDLPLHWQASVAGQWTATGLWHRTAHRTWADGPAWWYGDETTGDFDTGSANQGTLTTPVFAVPTGATFSFWSWRDAETSWDGTDRCLVELSDDGGVTWRIASEILDNGYGDAASWQWQHIDLTEWAGHAVTARFRFDSVDDVANDGEGWYIAGISAAGQRLEARGWCHPAAGTTAPGSTTACAVTIDTTGLAVGTRTVAVTIASDDPDTPTLIVSVPLTVTAAPVPELLGMVVGDASPDGDGDGWAEGGETISWSPRFANAGAEAVLTCTLTMDTTDPQVLVGSVSGTIAAGATGTLPPLRLRADSYYYDDVVRSGRLTVQCGGDLRTWPVALVFTRRATLGGRVVDAVTGTPLPGIQVQVLRYGSPAARPCTTTADGRFRFPDLLTWPTYTVAVDVAGQSPVREPVTLDGDRDVTIRVGRRLMQASTDRLACTLEAGGSTTLSFDLIATGSIAVSGSLRSAARTGSYVIETSDEVEGPAYAWEDIAATGTWPSPVMTLETVGPVGLGFAFPFYGTPYTTCRICTAGWISFTDRHVDTYSWNLPGTDLPRAGIMPAWDYPYFDASSAMRHRTDGDRFIVQADALINSSSSQRTSWQAVLDRNGTILLRQRQVPDRSDWLVAGMQDASGTQGATFRGAFAYADGNLDPTWRMRDGTAIRCTPSRPFARIADGSAAGIDIMPVALAAGGTTTVTIVCSAAGVPAGTWRDRILIATDALDHPWISIPVTLTVTGEGGGTEGGGETEVSTEGNGCGLGSGLAALLATVTAMASILLFRRRY